MIVYDWKYNEEYHILEVKIDKIKIMVHLQTYLIWCIADNLNILLWYFLILYLIFSKSNDSTHDLWL